MRCPNCGHNNSKVTDSRDVEAGIRRRRECLNCRVRFTTYERLQSTALMVSKRDSRREEFNREKLVIGVRKACAKRPITSRAIEKMVEDIEAELQRLGPGEVPSNVIGEMVIERLRQLDRVAYIRFASVYRDFQDIESFEQAVSDLREGNPRVTPPEAQAGRSRRTRRRAGAKPTLQRAPRVNGSEGHQFQASQSATLGGESASNE